MLTTLLTHMLTHVLTAWLTHMTHMLTHLLSARLTHMVTHVLATKLALPITEGSPPTRPRAAAHQVGRCGDARGGRTQQGPEVRAQILSQNGPAVLPLGLGNVLSGGGTLLQMGGECANLSRGTSKRA